MFLGVPGQVQTGSERYADLIAKLKQASKAELSKSKRKEAKLTSQVSKKPSVPNTDSGEGGKGAEIGRQNKTQDWGYKGQATITSPQDIPPLISIL